MNPDKTFENYKKEFEELCFTDDTECNHIQADDILKEIASCSNLTTQERFELVKIYNSVSKWFA